MSNSWFTPMPTARAIGRLFAETYGVDMPPEKGGKKEYFEWWDRVYAEVLAADDAPKFVDEEQIPAWVWGALEELELNISVAYATQTNHRASVEEKRLTAKTIFAAYKKGKNDA